MGATIIEALSKPTIITDDGVIGVVICIRAVVTVACVHHPRGCPPFMCVPTLDIMNTELILLVVIVLKEPKLYILEFLEGTGLLSKTHIECHPNGMPLWS